MDLSRLVATSEKVKRNCDMSFIRTAMQHIDWTDRLICIKGARGAGKTTLLIQHLKSTSYSPEEALYISLDDIFFTEFRLVELADHFSKWGGKVLYLDEVHKYPDWSRELKNLYDFYPELQIIFTASSALEIYKGEADLSRRCMIYPLGSLSFREYLALSKMAHVEALSLEDIVQHHAQIAGDLLQQIKPLPAFHDYLTEGCYPFFRENKKNYLIRLRNAVTIAIETDLLQVFKLDYSAIPKLKLLLQIISESVPFKPNIQKLSERMSTSRPTVMKYLDYLEKGHLIHMLYPKDKSMGILAKPEKIYLRNSNLCHAFALREAEKGNIRETFFLDQLSLEHLVHYTPAGDFLVNREMTFEIGGFSKTSHQVKDIPQAYLAKDDIETGHHNQIPLWLFGLLY